jgi:beta-lactam-binding protein with PASTA domain
MKLIKFIFSKTFLLQLFIAALIVVILGFATLEWLDSTTNHNQKIVVPDLSKMSLEKVDKKLKDLDLSYKVNDSANYNPDFPKYSVIEQFPKPGKAVKENRKIYVVLNPSNYATIEIPNLMRRTKRQVIPTLKSLGFEVGEITYKPDIAEDALLEMRSDGKEIKPGDKLTKTATIDLILGDGTRNYN